METKTCIKCGHKYKYSSYSTNSTLCASCRKSIRYKKQYENFIKNRDQHDTPRQISNIMKTDK